MNKDRFIAFLTLVALSGCATSHTPASLLARAPEAVYTSDKSPRAIADCIVSKWENTNVLGSSAFTNYRQTDTGYRVALHFADKLRYMADIDAIAAGSKTKVYMDGAIYSIGKNPQIAESASCQ